MSTHLESVSKKPGFTHKCCTFAIFFSWSRVSRRVCGERIAKTSVSTLQPVLAGAELGCCFLLRQDVLQRKPSISWHKNVRETLNPKTPSCSFISLFNRVLFPAPEGPLSTTGLGPDIVLRATDRRRRGKRDVLEICTDQHVSQEVSYGVFQVLYLNNLPFSCESLLLAKISAIPFARRRCREAKSFDPSFSTHRGVKSRLFLSYRCCCNLRINWH